MSTVSKCMVCNNETKTTCGKCKVIFYCTKECQIYDWSDKHKHFCPNLPIPKRLPKEKSVYAYLLQANEPSIKIIKIELNLESVPYYDGKKCLMPNYKPFFEKTGCRLVPTNPLVEPARNLPNTLEFVYADNFQFNGSQPNKCINAITGGKYGYNWTGAMLVMKIKDVDVENFGMGPHTYIDMEMNDLKDVRDWLLWYGSAHSDRFAEKRKQEISSLFPGFTFMNMS